MVPNFRVPLLFDVLQGRRANDREADQKYIRLRVRQRPQSIVVFLSSRIPQSEVDGAMVNHDVRGIVVEHGRNVLSRESIRGVTDEEASLTDSSITVMGDGEANISIEARGS
jgi:hypothetical protein